MQYEFISKALFFPQHGILVIGDLHIGYDEMLRQSGILVPERQIKELIAELKNIFKKIESKNHEIKKIIFIGDIKHAFSFEKTERNEFQEVIEFLGEKLPQENIILIKGNHDTIDYTFEGNFKDYHIEKDIAFIHGHEMIKQAFSEKIKTIVMGHLHPSIVLSDKAEVKRERYKCFLEGDYKGKKVLILPSFLDIIEGTPVNEFPEGYHDFFSIIPKTALVDFKVHVVGEDKVYEFGRVWGM